MLLPEPDGPVTPVHSPARALTVRPSKTGVSIPGQRAAAFASSKAGPRPDAGVGTGEWARLAASSSSVRSGISASAATSGAIRATRRAKAGHERTASRCPTVLSIMPVHMSTTIADSGAPTVPDTASGYAMTAHHSAAPNQATTARARPAPCAYAPRVSARRFRTSTRAAAATAVCDTPLARASSAAPSRLVLNRISCAVDAREAPSARASARSTTHGASTVVTNAASATGASACGRITQVLTSATAITSRCAAGGRITRGMPSRSSSMPPMSRSSRASPRSRARTLPILRYAPAHARRRRVLAAASTREWVSRRSA